MQPGSEQDGHPLSPVHSTGAVYPVHTRPLTYSANGVKSPGPRWAWPTRRVTGAWLRWSLNNKHCTLVIADRLCSWTCQQSEIKVCINAVHSRKPDMNNSQQAPNGVMTLICALFRCSFNSLFSSQMKEVRPLACLPAPLSAASNVYGRFQQPKQR